MRTISRTVVMVLGNIAVTLSQTWSTKAEMVMRGRLLMVDSTGVKRIMGHCSRWLDLLGQMPEADHRDTTEMQAICRLKV